MTQKVIAFTGISGVGKTTILRNLAEILTFQHVTGGSLITTARNAASSNRDAMRYTDLDENQRLLIKGFTLMRDPGTPLIIMDGHVIIDDGIGIAKISSEGFRALGVTLMVHLEADPAQILDNRSRDTSRSRPQHDVATLTQHQKTSRLHAKNIAESLNIGFHSVTHDDPMNLSRLLKEQC